MIKPSGINKGNIILGKGGFWQRNEFNSILLRILTHRRMYGASKTMKEAALNAAMLKKLSHILQCIHRLLDGLCWKAIH